MSPSPTGAPATWWGAMLRHTAVRATVIAVGAALVLLAVAGILERLSMGPTQYGSGALLVLAGFILYGLLWRGPVATAGLTWIGVEAGILLAAVVTGPGEAGWGPLVIYATEAGFVAAFAAFVGSWVRTALTRPWAQRSA